uniref:Innexin n=1 Tax=Plectus sambesii TaxID=2011161 RepID=A0A914XAX3_9BILA
MVFSEIVGTLSFLQPQADDDMSDRLNYYYTSTFLLVTAVLISLKMFGGRPVECWVPAEYKGSWEDYTEMFCWARSTYWVPFNEEIPDSVEEREERMVAYYQWTPFFLVVSAFMFYLPCLIWRLMYDKSGVRLRDIIGVAGDKSNIQPDLRLQNVKGLAAHLSSVFQHQFRLGTKHPNHHRFLRCLNFRYYEAYMTLLYISIKALFLINVIGQLLLMNKFLQTDGYNFYGIGVIIDLISGRPWHESGNFPRVTLCDMNIRTLGNVQRHTVQCVLVINIFTEKVFILLWMWYTALTIITLGSLISWIISSVSFEERRKFIARRLELADVEFKRAEYKDEIIQFVRERIKMDGVFVLRMLTIHTGVMVCTEVIDAMWDQFLLEEGKGDLLERASSRQDRTSGSDDETGGGLDVGSVGGDQAPRRKTSVLVPLMLPALAGRGIDRRHRHQVPLRKHFKSGRR